MGIYTPPKIEIPFTSDLSSHALTHHTMHTGFQNPDYANRPPAEQDTLLRLLGAIDSVSEHYHVPKLSIEATGDTVGRSTHSHSAVVEKYEDPINNRWGHRVGYLAINQKVDLNPDAKERIDPLDACIAVYTIYSRDGGMTALKKELIFDTFDPDMVTVSDGDAASATDLLEAFADLAKKQPFDAIED